MPSSVIYSATVPMTLLDASGGTRVLNVMETVTYDAPGHAGLYLWEYTIQNASATVHPIEAENGASGAVVIGYNQDVNEVPDNIDTTVDWENLGYDPGLVFWDSQIGHGDLNTETPFISIGTSQTFSFTTTPQPLANSYLTYAVTDVNDKSEDYYVYGATIKVPGPPVYWVGGTDNDGNTSNDNSWMNPNNWTSHEVPDQYTAVYFASSYSNYDAILPSSPVQVAEMHLVNGYSGTVTLGNTLSVGKFELTTGAISQPNAGNDLSVTKNFLWTGGILNSSANLATVTITGSTTTALFAPVGGGIVSLGSHVNLTNGAVATFLEGTISATNDALQFNINAGGMNADPGANKEAKFETSAGLNTRGPQVNLSNGSWLKVLSGQFKNNGSLKNEAGSFIIESGASAVFLKPVDGVVDGPAVKQTGGAIYLASGARLTALSSGTVGMLMSGGAIYIKSGVAPGEIWSDLKITGGDIRFQSMAAGDNHEFGTFKVTGDVTWTGGTYYPTVNGDPGEDDADLWWVVGEFWINGAPAVAPTAYDGENNIITPEADRSWRLFEAVDGILALANPSFTTGWDFTTEQDIPPTFWDLWSK